MSKIKIHCDDCIQILGNEYYQVHRWLDKMNNDFPIDVFSDYHRSFRHNSYGLRILKSISYKHEIAGRIHLIRDYYDKFTYKSISDIIKESNKLLIYYNNLNNFNKKSLWLLE